MRVAGPVRAEIVAFGVVHDGDVVEAFDHRGAQATEAGDLLVHGEGAEVEVEAVAGGLGAAGAAEPDVGFLTKAGMVLLARVSVAGAGLGLGRAGRWGTSR
jgi:hypothetical protein